ncbi:MAG: hypothetical protein R3E50_06660 [Halioglobus sp.]
MSTAHAIRSSCSVGLLLLELGARLEFRLHRACVGAGIELPAFAARGGGPQHVHTAARNKIGIAPGAGGTVRFPRIGRQRTAYLALSARRISAATALQQWGWWMKSFDAAAGPRANVDKDKGEK